MRGEERSHLGGHHPSALLEREKWRETEGEKGGEGSLVRAFSEPLAGWVLTAEV